MKKKILKITGILVLVFVGILVAIPFFLEAKLGDIIKSNVNSNTNAHLDFAAANLSLIGSFPNAEISLEGVTLINNSPFEGDTLFSSKQIELKMGVGELFKDADASIEIASLVINDAKLHIKVDKEGNANYDIGMDTQAESKVQATPAFTFNLQSYVISDTRITYEDEASRIKLELDDFQHQGRGDLSLGKSELETTTNALVSFERDSSSYLTRNKISLEALIGIDLDENKYTFLENKAVVNQLPLVFDGHVKLEENGQWVNITFGTPSSDFKNFLALLPADYSKNIEDIETTGTCSVTGELKGMVDERHIPSFKVAISSENASFKYPDLPKTVNDVQLDIRLNNESGVLEDTYVNIQEASFRIDSDTFSVKSVVTDLLGNTAVKADAEGILNLGNLSKAYPFPENMEMKGMLKAKVSTAFDMASLEQKRYGQTQTSGHLDLSDFEYASSEFRHPVKISKAAMTFNPATVMLNTLDGVMGETDFKANGTIGNLLGFVFNDEKIQGDFNVSSTTFALDDFMTKEANSEAEEDADVGEQIKIPSFLECTIKATAKRVLYDNLILTDVIGELRVADEKAVLTNMTSSLFKGQVSLNGEVSTKTSTPSFTMSLGMEKLGIAESFKSLEMFQVLAPIAQAMQGSLNSDFEIKGNLHADLTPDLNTVTGNVLAELLTTKINVDQTKVLSALANSLDFIDLDKLDLKELKTALSFEEGKVLVKPFQMNYQDISISVSGNHTFDKALNYSVKLDVPSKYLGAEVNSLIRKIDAEELEGLTIPVIATIGGAYSNPEVKTDLTSGIQGLTAKLVEIQKEKLVNTGTDKTKGLLGDILSGTTSKNDTTTSEKPSTKEEVKSILGNVLGANTEENDSISQQKDTAKQQKTDPVKEVTKNILGGLLGGKKKKDSSTTQKDSVN